MNQKKQEQIYITKEELASAQPAGFAPYIPPYAPPAPPAGSSTTAETATRVCPNPRCMRVLSITSERCPHCGTVLRIGPGEERVHPPLNRSTAALLAILPGLLGFFGIGHFYAQLLGQGFLYLFAGWLVLGGAIYCLTIGEIVWGIALIVLYIAIFIWQVFDAVNAVDQYNEPYMD